VGLVVRRRPVDGEPLLSAEQGLRDLAESTAAAVRDARLTALVGALDDATVGVLLSVAASSRTEPAVESLATVLRGRGEEHDPVVAMGSEVRAVPDVRRSFLEAAHVADAAVHEPARPFHRLEDVRLRGLLHLLRDDARLQTFVEREVGPLLAYDAARGSDLTGLLATYLAHGRNKSAAADSAHLSRPAFYERLHKIERVLGVDLDAVESCLSLHVAVIAREALQR
jgi:purine catabolism regulator